jgi:cysteine desulfurase/selenocysteine lyase
MNQLSDPEIAALRRQFPLFQRLPQLAYLDNAATAQTHRSALQAINDYYTNYCANVQRGSYPLAEEASFAYQQARQEVAGFLRAAEEQIVFTSSATAAINLVALATELQPGDKIALSEMEHHSNIVPWYLLAQRSGAEIDWIKVDSQGRLDAQSWQQVIARRPRVLALTQISNVTGVVNPLGELVPEARQAGAVVLIDGTQAAPRLALRAGEHGEDFFVFSGHKTFGPTGVGVLWGRDLPAMEPPLGGGAMISRVSRQRIDWAPAPQRFESGTPPIAAAIGLGAALRWLQNQPRQRFQAHEQDLAQIATERLQQLGAQVWSASGIVSFALPGIHAHDAAEIIARQQVAVRAGHHCAEILVRRLGPPALVRASFAPYNSAEQLERLIAGVEQCLEIFAD